MKAGRPCLYVKWRVSVRKELLTHCVSTWGHSKGSFPPTFLAALWCEGSWFLNRGSNPRPLQWKDGVQFPGQPGRSEGADCYILPGNDLSQGHAEK